MKKRFFATPIVIVATFVVPAVSGPAAAQTETMSLEASGVATSAVSLDVSLRTHDDWPLASSFVAPTLDVSARTHDDWMIPTP